MESGHNAGAEFAEVAERYCGLLDRHQASGGPELVRALYVLLPELLFRASALPRGDASEESELSDPLGDDGWRAIFESLTDTLGELDLYWEVFDPTALGDDDPMTATLSDDLADIYRDLRRGLGLPGSPLPSRAVWDWRFDFESHWGHHAIDALRTMHALMYSHGLGDDA